jgi:uncharacterized membrane protein YhaH (DUF805 family)
VVENNRKAYWLRLALFTALALLPVVGGFLIVVAIHARAPSSYLLMIVGVLMILALPVGKFMLFPNTTLEHMYRGWILRRLSRG